MNIIKWDPFRELEDMSNRLNRLFGVPGSRSEVGNDLLSLPDWSPTADVSETDTAYLIKAEIPGVNKEDVKVTVENGMLTMEGERKMEKEEKNRKFHRVERSFGKFMRSYQLPEDVDENSVKAEFRDGMLSITLAKTEKARAKPRAVEVKVT